MWVFTHTQLQVFAHNRERFSTDYSCSITSRQVSNWEPTLRPRPSKERIPLLVRRGGREIKGMRRSLRIRADGVVAHTETFLVTDHPGCANSNGDFFFLAQPPLLTR